MKTLSDHTLIYDAECPLCRAYTGSFIKYKLLDGNGRNAYHQFPFGTNGYVNKAMACNKIALINTQTHEVTYGLDSLIKVLAYRFPLVGKVCSIRIVHAFLSWVYAFISYNRKMIAPGSGQSRYSCTPERNVKARIAFVVFCTVLIHLIVTWYFNTFFSSYKIPGVNVYDGLLFMGLLGFQFVVFKVLKQQNFYDYAGQVAFVSLLGALMLGVTGLAFRTMAALGMETAFLSVITFGAVTVIMFYEHLRRVKLYGWSTWVCLTWILFRILIYPLVFNI